MMRFLDPTIDIAFKKVFGNENKKEILISFLNSVLEHPQSKQITHVEINDPSNLPETIESKYSIVDVKCTDQTGKKYIVEMQILDQSDFPERCQYYTALSLARQLNKKEFYTKIRPVIFVGIVSFNMFKSPEYLSHHLILNKKTKEHSLKAMEFHFIELNKFNNELNDSSSIIDKWTYFLKNASILNQIPKSLKKIAPINDSFKILEQSYWSEKELDAYDKLLDNYRVKGSCLLTAKEKGLREGKKEGRKEGKIEGRIEAAKEIAKELFGILDEKIISQKTGLSIQEIQNLNKRIEIRKRFSGAKKTNSFVSKKIESINEKNI